MSPLRHGILDMDGTVYQLKGDAAVVTFPTSVFYRDLRQRITAFLSQRLGQSLVEAEQTHQWIHRCYDGQVSRGVECEYVIDRYDFFAHTWNCDPAPYITRDPTLAVRLRPFAGQLTLLTSAPRVWAGRVLDYLNLASVFGSRIYTGEPDLRKPNPDIFRQIAAGQGLPPQAVVSVGDQYHTDIAPAQSIGMATILIGPEQQTADYRVDTIAGALDILEQRLVQV